MFNTEEYEKYIAAEELGINLNYLPQATSTNTRAKKTSKQEGLHGTVIITDEQTGGRGQHNRKWESQKNKNLTFTLILEPTRREGFSLLTLACALAVTKIIEQYGDLSLSLKWPNDIYCEGKKLCGLLTETQFTGNKLDRVIIGIGLNVNQTSFSDEIDEKATSIKKEYGKQINREKLLALMLEAIETNFQKWEKKDPNLPHEINSRLIGYGKWVRITINEELEKEQYKFLGVNGKGELVTLRENLDIRSFSYEQVRVLI